MDLSSRLASDGGWAHSLQRRHCFGTLETGVPHLLWDSFHVTHATTVVAMLEQYMLDWGLFQSANTQNRWNSNYIFITMLCVTHLVHRMFTD